MHRLDEHIVQSPRRLLVADGGDLAGGQDREK
jgi:hypothetical protein